ncbi:MAG: hypothetical protein ACRENP_12210 [Longimicrobiales bacterium]
MSSRDHVSAGGVDDELYKRATLNTSNLPPVLATEPLEQATERIKEKLAEHVKWDGEDSSAVRTARWCLAEFEKGMRDACELWRPTSDAARITGWEEATLTKWARRKLAGEKLPFAWRSLEVTKAPDGYRFRVSSIPAKGARSA